MTKMPRMYESARARHLHLAPRLAARFALALLAVAVAALPAAAGTIIGPSDCTSCHEHDKQTKALQGAAHDKSLDALESPKAMEFVKKLGIKDQYADVCTNCHATVVDGSPDYGVSCESCHGGASDYLKPHQTKGTYEKALTLGMLRTRDLPVRAKNCVGCHIVREAKLLGIGHSTGAEFDIVANSKKISHWTETKSDADIKAAWDKVLAESGGLPAGGAKAAPAPPAKSGTKSGGR